MNVEVTTLTPKQIWQLNSNTASAWINYAEELESIGKISEAFTIFEAALVSPQITSKVRLAERYAELASKYCNMEEGNALFQKLRDVKETNKLIDSYLNFLIRHRQPHLAEDFLSRDSKIYGTNTYWFRLADIYEGKGLYDKAIPIYEKLIERNRANADAWNRLREAERSKATTAKPDSITKSINFEPEHHSAGLAILQNFGSILRNKYPEGDVAFSIEQSGLKVTMTIEHPEGQREIVEDYLNRYGLVVSGMISPEQYTQNPLEIMDLKRQLINYESELKWAHEKQLMLQGIVSKQDLDLAYFKSKLETVLLDNRTLSLQHADFTKELLGKLNTQDDNLTQLVKQLIKSAEQHNQQEIHAVSTKIAKTNPTILEKIKEFTFITIASAGANTPAWIEYLSKTIP
ncbi:hypothetical protein AB5A11_003716 [Vibrio cholerae]|uniref:tetratricopeptide repeat protein n=1 Tax=Vibrio TaxID=662 RepID=UPI00115BB331|nr:MULTISPECIES: tetratricopeptide repeat protein [Vibrio]EGR2123868.1 tetratricopeptide repeat protein [Vibrio cholerae]EGR3963748.1 tetratricopeptide repeat protein [Vibrio cholerae]KAA1223565.1 hypothetical protein F0Q18_17605 [Vibrio cholerae]MBP8550996.1 hypothetical protein [Vibrio paracholerae]MEB5521747.1 hypothetical protein [Vibrio cholerae]